MSLLVMSGTLDVDMECPRGRRGPGEGGSVAGTMVVVVVVVVAGDDVNDDDDDEDNGSKGRSRVGIVGVEWADDGLSGEDMRGVDAREAEADVDIGIRDAELEDWIGICAIDISLTFRLN